MGCQRGHYDERCITDVVRDILNAQRRAVEETTAECDTSCDSAIDELLSPRRDRRPPRHTTIPFMLISKGTNKPFVGTGFVNRNRDGSRRRDFECIESPIFKVRGFTRGSDNCVRLELLLPVSRRRDGEEHSEHGGRRDHDHHHSGGFCDQFGNRRIDNFRETGLCITVDLNCFCGITCLDPITPDPR